MATVGQQGANNNLQQQQQQYAASDQQSFGYRFRNNSIGAVPSSVRDNFYSTASCAAASVSRTASFGEQHNTQRYTDTVSGELGSCRYLQLQQAQQSRLYGNGYCDDKLAGIKESSTQAARDSLVARVAWDSRQQQVSNVSCGQPVGSAAAAVHALPQVNQRLSCEQQVGSDRGYPLPLSICGGGWNAAGELGIHSSQTAPSSSCAQVTDGSVARTQQQQQDSTWMDCSRAQPQCSFVAAAATLVPR